MFGITIPDHRNKKNVFTMEGTVALYLHNSNLYVNGSDKEASDYRCNNGDRLGIRVNMANHTVSWERTHPTPMQIAAVKIPKNIMHLPFYPYLDFYSRFDG
jgi:hypothetical protein